MTSGSLCLTLFLSGRDGEITKSDFSLLTQPVSFDLSIDDDKEYIVTIRSYRMECSSYARLFSNITASSSVCIASSAWRNLHVLRWA